MASFCHCIDPQTQYKECSHCDDDDDYLNQQHLKEQHVQQQKLQHLKRRSGCCFPDSVVPVEKHLSESRDGRAGDGKTVKPSLFPLASMLLKVCLLIAFAHNEVSASGRLVEPTMRSSLWRFDPDAPVNYNDQGLNCGGLQIQYGLNAGLCGVCGDSYSGLRDNEDGGLYASGGVVRRYRSGSRVTMVADLIVPKGGYFEVKLCPRDQLTTIVTQECFDAFTLKIRNGRGRRLQVGNKPRQDSGLYKLEVQLPPGVTCTHCVIQWRYVTAPTSPSSSYGLSANGGATCADCPGPREEFRNCADVTIGYYGDQEASSGQPDDLTRGKLSEKIQTYIFSTGVDPIVVNREQKNYRFASRVDFTDNNDDDSSSEDSDDDDDRRFRPGRFSEWPQRLPSARPGQESGFGYATLLLGSQGRGDQALGSIRENLNRNNRQKFKRQNIRGGGSSEESGESDEDDDDSDDEDRVTFPRRLPGFEDNINEIQIPAINENYDRHTGISDITGLGYGDPYSPGAGDYTTGLDGTFYGDNYDGQGGFNDNTGGDYNDQYGTNTGANSGLDGTLYGDNYGDQSGINDNTGLDFNDQFGINTGENSGLDGNIPGVSIDPFAGLFGGNFGGQTFELPSGSFLEPASTPSTYFPPNGDQGSFMNTADPANPFVAFFRRKRPTSEFQDQVDNYNGEKTSGMSYADLMDRISSGRRRGTANGGNRATSSPRLSKPPTANPNEFYSDSIEPGYDQGDSFGDFPNEPVSDYPSQGTNVPTSNLRQGERNPNPLLSPFNPERIINGIKSALERLVSPRQSRNKGALDVQTDMLRDRLSRLAGPSTTLRAPLTRSSSDRSPAGLPGLTSLPSLISERGLVDPESLHQLNALALQRQEQLLGGLQPRRQGFNLNMSLSSESVPPIGSLPLPGLMPPQDPFPPFSSPQLQGLHPSSGSPHFQESLPPLGSPHFQESLPPLGSFPSQGPLHPMGSFPPVDPSLSFGSPHSSGLPHTPPFPNPNSNPASFHWLPDSAHDMSAMGENFHFLNAHAANQYLSPYAEAARTQPSLLCARPELLVCMATPMYRQAIPGADVICTESCRRGEACGPEYCACACQQTLQCFHQSSFGNGRSGQRIFGAAPGLSNEDAWCTAQCSTGTCPNDQCVCSLV